MRILYLVPYPPSPIRVRPFQMLRALARRGLALTVATLWSDANERRDIERLRDEGFRVIAEHLPATRSLWNCARALPGTTPLQAAYCWQPRLARAVLERLESEPFDVVHVEHLRGARYGEWLRAHLCPRTRPPFVWDSVDSITHLFEQTARHSDRLWVRTVARHELRRLRGYEARLAAGFDRVVVTSPVDRGRFEALMGPSHGPRPAVIPNGVDLDAFTPPSHRADGATVVMTGKMSYHANVHAARRLLDEIMPRVWRRRPDARLLIVGRNPPRALRRRARDAAGPVTVTGTVFDMRPYLHQAAVAVAPLVYGAGVQNKVLEAMASGLAVVASPCALAGLSPEASEGALCAEGSCGLAEHIADLLDRPDRAEALGRAGRAFVERHHRWDAMAERLQEVYAQLR